MILCVSTKWQTSSIFMACRWHPWRRGLHRPWPGTQVNCLVQDGKLARKSPLHHGCGPKQWRLLGRLSTSPSALATTLKWHPRDHRGKIVECLWGCFWRKATLNLTIFCRENIMKQTIHLVLGTCSTSRDCVDALYLICVDAIWAWAR